MEKTEESSCDLMMYDNFELVELQGHRVSKLQHYRILVSKSITNDKTSYAVLKTVISCGVYNHTIHKLRENIKINTSE